jgi:hypothetical protein
MANALDAQSELMGRNTIELKLAQRGRLDGLHDLYRVMRGRVGLTVESFAKLPVG